jgi:hypothetical protein
MTAEEILLFIANRESYSSWYELMGDTHEQYQIECTIEAMEMYLQQHKPEFDDTIYHIS